MNNVLVVTASARYEGSHTRDMASVFMDKISQQHPRINIVQRDLTAEQLPPVTEEMLTGFFSKTNDLPDRVKASLSLSNRLCEELLEADVIAIATPMYNFNVPASLKAWIDLVVRAGVTFEKLGDGNLRGLCSGKRAIVMCSMGGAFARHQINLVEPYLKIIADFIGLDEIRFVYMEGTAQQGFDAVASLADAAEIITDFIKIKEA